MQGNDRDWSEKISSFQIENSEKKILVDRDAWLYSYNDVIRKKFDLWSIKIEKNI